MITCDTSNGTDLGKKAAGFSISYTVGDEDGDTVTVTEAIDGVQVGNLWRAQGPPTALT